MNVIAMKVGKSRSIESSSVGDTLVVNCTKTPSYLALSSARNMECVDIEGGFSYLNDHSDFIDATIEDYDTIIFYTCDKWEGIKMKSYEIESLVQDKNIIFMVNEL